MPSNATTARFGGPTGPESAPLDGEQLYTQADAARLIGVGERCLENWRVRGGGPKFVRISSRCIRYRRRDVLDWISHRLRSSTADGQEAA